MKNWFKKVIDIKNWQTKTKIVTCLVVVALIACTILAFMTPTRTQMEQQASPYMQRYIEKDKTLERKRVTTTYNNLIVINYVSFSTSGANGKTERYVGIVNTIHKANKGAWKTTGQMVNYTYRMLGVGENLMHGAKLTILLTVLSIIFGVLLGIILALGKIAKNKIISGISSAYIFFFRTEKIIKCTLSDSHLLRNLINRHMYKPVFFQKWYRLLQHRYTKLFSLFFRKYSWFNS